ncbi:phospholipase A2 [Streptomyces sp. NRRL S-1022]|uniref:phospholipase A2 n=1 Tax=Streptomyces sp. NRRL S-1022 TaxID=1463880 RepID=UPI00068E9F9D|nr:phospholipase A2 [Streptomyces sp. NRRL S-1022]
MRKAVVPVITALSLSLLLPMQQASAATVDPPLATGEIQQIGPGLYFSESQSFQISEGDVAVGAIGRRHSVVAQAGGAAQPESAPASRADIGAFGPGWEAEFLGGTLNRKLEQQGSDIVVTDLDVGESFRYSLTSSIAYPSGGGVNKYQTTDGSKITETTKWDASAGALVTTVVESLGADLSATETGDDTFTDASGNPVPSADLKPTYTWKQAAPGTDKWRVTGVGSTSNGTSTVGYDTQGRVSTITEPAAGETPQQSLTVTYASNTTASGSTYGDYQGRAKEISLTAGTTTQTVARYAYDASGRLRTMTNPVESAEPVASYSYDTTGRVSTISSPANGAWDLTFPAGSAAPNVESTGLARPASQSTFQGAAGITDPGASGPPAADFTTGEISDPQSYPRQCSTATSWLWYTKAGCAAWVAHYGWHAPYWKKLPSGYWVVGINHDHCTQSPDKPSGYDFRSACDMHDYGYGLIGNTYKGYKYYLDRSKKSNVDNAFHTTLRDYTCSAYRFKSVCRSIAYTYLKFVQRYGNPKNGANAT